MRKFNKKLAAYGDICLQLMVLSASLNAC